MGKRYVVHLYKRNIHAKNHVDWIKIEVTTEVQSLPVQLDARILLTGIPDPAGFFEKNFLHFSIPYFIMIGI